MGKKMTFQKPIVIGSIDESGLNEIRSNNDIIEEIDIFDFQIQELYKISNPSLNNEDIPDEFRSGIDAVYVYYPWTRQLLRCVSDEHLFKLRTNRNREIITMKEQEELANSVIGVAGMSVGAGIATSLVYSGMSRRIKISDFDTLDTSNLNRLRESLLSVGHQKTTLAARHIYELDPFAQVDIFDKGLNNENLNNFFKDLDVVVDEIDDFKMKVKLRQYAKKFKIPLLMFTSLGDNILIDVERYDVDKDLQMFNGLIDGVSEDILSNSDIDDDAIRRYSVQLVGAKYVPTRALSSLTKMGKELVGRPQLYSTIAVDGGIAAYLIRQIMLGIKVESGRYFINFGSFLNLDETELEMTQNRIDILNKF
jgi:hypothetical protein